MPPSNFVSGLHALNDQPTNQLKAAYDELKLAYENKRFELEVVQNDRNQLREQLTSQQSRGPLNHSEVQSPDLGGRRSGRSYLYVLVILLSSLACVSGVAIYLAVQLARSRARVAKLEDQLRAETTEKLNNKVQSNYLNQTVILEKTENLELRAENSFLSQANGELGAENLELKGQNGLLNQTLGELNTENLELKEQKGFLNQALGEKDAEIGRLNGAMGDLKRTTEAEINAREQTIADLRRRLDCFTPETIVVTKDGPREIRTLKVDDEVQTLNNGEKEWTKVTKVEAVRGQESFCLLQFAEGTLSVTSKHLVFVGGKKVTADAVRVGDNLSGKIVTGIKRASGAEKWMIDTALGTVLANGVYVATE